MSDDTDFDMTTWNPETGWSRPPGPPGPWGRPPTGAWPPCPQPGFGPPPARPPMPPWPPDLEACWDKVKATKELLKKMLADVLDENPELLARVEPVFGVTDGSDALPGTVGEFVRLVAPDIHFPIDAAYTTTAIAGILPAGDWAVQCYAYLDTEITGAQFYLDPQPEGVSDSMGAVLALQGRENITLVGPMQRASLSAATVLSFSCTTNNDGPGTAPGIMSVRVNAWRVR